MNKTIYNFPKANPITCVWFETGDSRRPLACVWMDNEIQFLKTASTASAKPEVEGIRRCA
jgi:hypothetical protein